MSGLPKYLFPVENALKAFELKGKKVWAANGKEIGKIKEVFLNAQNFGLDGVLVEREPTELDAYIKSNHLEYSNGNVVRITIALPFEYRGERVFDSLGKEIGSIKEIVRTESTNEIVSLVIDRGLAKQNLTVLRSAVQSVPEGIFLAKGGV